MLTHPWMMVVFAVGAFAVALGTDAEATPGEEALELWGTSIVSYAWYWLCLWPMIAVHLRAGQITEAIDASHQLLAPPQQRFPDDLESLLEAAEAAWEENEPRVAGDKLAEALQLAVTLGFA